MIIIEVQLKNAKQERKGLLEKIPSLRDKLNTYEQLESSYEQVNFDMLKTYLDAPNKLVTVTKQLQKEIKELEDITKNQDIIQLQKQISEYEAQEKRLSSQVNTLVGDKRTLENEIENTKNLLSGLNEQLEKKIIELMLHCKAVTELSNIGVGIPTTLHHAADAKFACRRRATILAYQFRKFFDARCCRKALRHATAFRTTHRRNEDFIAKVVVLRHEILLQSLTVNLVRNRASALTSPQLVLAKQLICSCLKHCLV